MVRELDPGRDLEDCRRVWRDAGWLEKGQEDILDIYLAGHHGLVGEAGGRVEALGLSTPGSVRYLGRDIPLCAVTSVTTGYAGRRRGLAGRLTAGLLARGASEGAALAGLGMFEQGFYDRLGFGTGPYETIISLDPAMLELDVDPPVPARLTPEDYGRVHRCRLASSRAHGNATLFREEITRAEMRWARNGFGLGFPASPVAELTHHLWFGRAEGEHGPYSVAWMAYRDGFQLLELLALLRSLGDQVSLVRLAEPPGVQLQDLVRMPLRTARATKGGRFPVRAEAVAYWQLRMLDVERCLAETRLPWDGPEMNLRLEDPADRLMPEDGGWRGVAGSYVVRLGRESSAERGRREGLPLLEASVGAFTRMWLGVRPAGGLRLTDSLAGPDGLVSDLDEALRLPRPRIAWDY